MAGTALPLYVAVMSFLVVGNLWGIARTHGGVQVAEGRAGLRPVDFLPPLARARGIALHEDAPGGFRDFNRLQHFYRGRRVHLPPSLAGQTRYWQHVALTDVVVDEKRRVDRAAWPQLKIAWTRVFQMKPEIRLHASGAETEGDDLHALPVEGVEGAYLLAGTSELPALEKHLTTRPRARMGR